MNNHSSHPETHKSLNWIKFYKAAYPFFKSPRGIVQFNNEYGESVR